MARLALIIIGLTAYVALIHYATNAAMAGTLKLENLYTHGAAQAAYISAGGN